jgi:hypothetical protein
MSDLTLNQLRWLPLLRSFIIWLKYISNLLQNKQDLQCTDYVIAMTSKVLGTEPACISSSHVSLITEVRTTLIYTLC